MLTILPVALNTLSDGAEVARIAKIQDSNLQTLGYFEWLTLHQSKGLLYETLGEYIGCGFSDL
jgi:hypothetical protein